MFILTLTNHVVCVFKKVTQNLNDQIIFLLILCINFDDIFMEGEWQPGFRMYNGTL